MATMLDFFALLVAQKKSVLPVGYTELESIEAPNERSCILFNTQWNEVKKIEVEIKFNANNIRMVFNSGVGTTSPYIAFQNMKTRYGGSLTGDYFSISDMTVFNNYTFTNIVSSSTNKISTASWDSTWTDHTTYKKIKFYGANDELLVSTIPCINPQNQVGMFDIVSQTFFGNVGTVSFIPHYKFNFQYNQLIPDGQINKSITVNSSPSANQLDPYILIKDPSLVGHKVYAKITSSDARLRVGWYKSLNTGYDFATGTEITANSQAPTATEGIYEITQDMVHSGTNYLQLYFFKGAGVQTGTHNITIQLVDLTALGMQNITNTVLFKATDLGKYLDAGNTLEFTGTTNKTYNS